MSKLVGCSLAWWELLLISSWQLSSVLNQYMSCLLLFTGCCLHHSFNIVPHLSFGAFMLPCTVLGNRRVFFRFLHECHNDAMCVWMLFWIWDINGPSSIGWVISSLQQKQCSELVMWIWFCFHKDVEDDVLIFHVHTNATVLNYNYYFISITQTSCCPICRHSVPMSNLTLFVNIL